MVFEIEDDKDSRRCKTASDIDSQVGLSKLLKKYVPEIPAMSLASTMITNKTLVGIC